MMTDKGTSLASSRTGSNTSMNNPIDDTHDYVNELEQDNKHLRELLKEIIEMDGYCSFCWANAKQDHADGCVLGKALVSDQREEEIADA